MVDDIKLVIKTVKKNLQLTIFMSIAIILLFIYGEALMAVYLMLFLGLATATHIMRHNNQMKHSETYKEYKGFIDDQKDLRK